MSAASGVLRVPPHSTDAEKAILGQLFAYPKSIHDIGDLKPEQFYSHDNQKIFSTMIDVSNAGQVIDIITVAEGLQKTGNSDINLEILGSLATSISGAKENFKPYCDVVLNKYRQRQEIQNAMKYTQALWDGEEGAFGELLLSRDDDKSDYDGTLQESLARTIQYMDDIYNGKVEPGIPTGIEKFDEIFGGLHNSDFIVIGARPSMGKTAFLCNLALNCKLPVGFISAEQGMDQITQRLMSIKARVNSHKFRNGKFNDDDWARITASNPELVKREFYYYDNPSPHIKEVIQKAVQWKERYGIGMLCVDYLQFLRGDGSSKHEQVSDISRGLKTLARRLDIPVICVAQLNRGVESRDNKRPVLSDLKDSGSIEQDADSVIFLYRPWVYDKQDSNGMEIIDNRIEVDHKKSRHGRTGKVTTGWIPEYFTVLPNFEKNGNEY